MEDWAEIHSPSPNLDIHELEVITALHQSSDVAISFFLSHPFQEQGLLVSQAKGQAAKELTFTT